MITPELRRLLVEVKDSIYESRNTVAEAVTTTDSELSEAAIVVSEQAAKALDQLISDAESCFLGE